jgi:hypothetical protein
MHALYLTAHLASRIKVIRSDRSVDKPIEEIKPLGQTQNSNQLVHLAYRNDLENRPRVTFWGKHNCLT